LYDPVGNKKLENMSTESQKPQPDAMEIPFMSLTPLYCIVTDADEIELGCDTSLCRFSEEQLKFLGENDRFVAYLQLHKPQCLLWERKLLSWSDVSSLAEEMAKQNSEHRYELDQNLVMVD
jgi:hypothetical protein